MCVAISFARTRPDAAVVPAPAGLIEETAISLLETAYASVPAMPDVAKFAAPPVAERAPVPIRATESSRTIKLPGITVAALIATLIAPTDDATGAATNTADPAIFA